MIAPKTEITVIKNSEEILRVTVKPGEYVIGRDHDCDVVVEEEDLSRRHAMLTINFDHALIEDLGSSNGTFVNEMLLEGCTRLWPNQKIRIGASTYLSVRRLKTDTTSTMSLAPTQQMIKRVLPVELLRDKKYDIGGIVAQGGMGAILSARELTIDRSVAMKVMLDSLSQDGLLRFIAEAKVTGQLEHPNIVPVYELGVDENEQVFYTMKYVRGVTLKEVIEKIAAGDKEAVEKYSLPVLLNIFQKVCDAIAFAHDKGVIHRDLKPENIMIGDFGEVLVMDWGLAKILAKNEKPSSSPHTPESTFDEVASASTTLDGVILGTPQYMSPEQAEGRVEELDIRSDIYSLGAILYCILSHRPPVSREDANDVVERVKTGNIDPLTPPNKKSKIPDSLVAVVKKAMSWKRKFRYKTIATLQADLSAYQNGFATRAEKAGFLKQLQLFTRRNKAASFGVVAVLLVGGILGTKAFLEGRRANATLAELRQAAPTFYEQAKIILDDGNMEEALRKVGYAIKLDGSNPDFRLLKANLLESTEHPAEAAKEYRRVLTQRPGDEVATINLALCEKLLKESGGGKLGSAQQVELLSALRHQKRLIEAAPLAALINPDINSAKAAILARLHEVRKQPGWKDSRVYPLSNGTFRIDLERENSGDLSVLKGMPVSELNLTQTGVSDITPLAGLPLKKLLISSDKVQDLSPLRGMKLEQLEAADNQITDLSPLSGMPLTHLDCHGNTNLSDISPLRGMPLIFLDLSKAKIADLSPITGAPLEHLSLVRTFVSDLSPLKKCLKLTDLDISGDFLSDLSPLTKLPLSSLICRSRNLRDIAPLRGMPLRSLALDHTQVTDVSPLAGCSNLEDLILPEIVTNITILRNLHQLRTISTHAGPSGGFPAAQTAEQFWKEYDANHSGAVNHAQPSPAPSAVQTKP